MTTTDWNFPLSLSDVVDLNQRASIVGGRIIDDGYGFLRYISAVRGVPVPVATRAGIVRAIMADERRLHPMPKVSEETARADKAEWLFNRLLADHFTSPLLREDKRRRLEDEYAAQSEPMNAPKEASRDGAEPNR